MFWIKNFNITLILSYVKYGGELSQAVLEAPTSFPKSGRQASSFMCTGKCSLAWSVK
jgi:hypothetical protein